MHGFPFKEYHQIFASGVALTRG